MMQQPQKEMIHPQSPVKSPAACDDYFGGGEWVSSTVQYAVTQFFGDSTNQQNNTHDDGENSYDQHDENDNDTLPAVSTNAGGDKNNGVHKRGRYKTTDTEIDEVSNTNIKIPLISPPPDDNNTTHTENQTADDGSKLVGSVMASSYQEEEEEEDSRTLLSNSSNSGCGAVSEGVKTLYGLQCQDMMSPTASSSIEEEAINDGVINNDGDGDDDDTTKVNSWEIFQQVNQQSSDVSAATYFVLSDFNPQTWLIALQDTHSTIRYSMHAAAALTAVIVIHPLALSVLGATAVTMYAVGVFQELDKGYQIWSEEFSSLFWEDNDGSATTSNYVGMKMIAAAADDNDTDLATVATTQTDNGLLLEQERQKLGEKVKVIKVESGKLLTDLTTDQNEQKKASGPPPLGKTKPSRKGYGLRRIKSAPVSSISKPASPKQTSILTTIGGKPSSLPIKPNKLSKKPKQPASIKPATIHPTTANSKIIDRHFPPLEICVIDKAELSGLNTTSQFFDVFYADDAPYSFRDFQKKRGDVDIVYGRWEECMNENDDEAIQNVKVKESSSACNSTLEPLPSNSTRQRTLKFNTLTKSYFGHAYAKATKIQRATKLANGSVLVIENVTQLADIPFSDRFLVIERWVLEIVAERKQDGNREATTTTAPTATICTLTVHAEVQMLKDCSWEAQIRRKASETFTEMVVEWTKSATVALVATEEQKRERLRQSDLDEGADEASGLSMPPLVIPPLSDTTLPIPKPITPTPASLFAKHKSNFDELDKLIANGDLEWCSVEVTHTSDKSSAFSTVLEHPSLNECDMSSSNSIARDKNGNRKPRFLGLLKRLSPRSKQRSPRSG